MHIQPAVRSDRIADQAFQHRVEVAAQQQFDAALGQQPAQLGDDDRQAVDHRVFVPALRARAMQHRVENVLASAEQRRSEAMLSRAGAPARAQRGQLGAKASKWARRMPARRAQPPIMTVGQPGGIIWPVGEGIGATQEACCVMSPTRAAGWPPISDGRRGLHDHARPGRDAAGQHARHGHVAHAGGRLAADQHRRRPRRDDRRAAAPDAAPASAPAPADGSARGNAVSSGSPGRPRAPPAGTSAASRAAGRHSTTCVSSGARLQNPGTMAPSVPFGNCGR